MSVVGSVDSLWRYPVKSMRGEQIEEAFVSFAGVYGDRLFAFRDSANPKGFPYLTGREQQEMVLYRPRFRHPEKAARPPNLTDAEGIEPGLTPLFAAPEELALDVETPSDELYRIDDPALLSLLYDRLGEGHTLTLLRSDRAMTDCRPVALFSLQTAHQLADEIGVAIDKRRFRANIYMDLDSGGFAEDGFVGRELRIGPKLVVSVLERDPRCKMITLDPDTAEANPAVLRTVVRAHENRAGVYGAVLIEGTVRPGDAIELVD